MCKVEAVGRISSASQRLSLHMGFPRRCEARVHSHLLCRCFLVRNYILVEASRRETLDSRWVQGVAIRSDRGCRESEGVKGVRGSDDQRWVVV